MGRILLSVTTESGTTPVTVETGPSWSYLIGRSVSADLVLSAAAVSRRHCRLFARDDEYLVEDLASRVGTLLGDDKVAGHTVIRHGDILRVGPVAITFESGHSLAGKSALSDTTTSASDPPRQAAAVVRAAHGAIAIPGPGLLIGRDTDCAHRIDDLGVSRRHARIDRAGNACTLSDLQSTNGTFVNGRRVRSPLRLQPGDLVSIGAYHFGFDGQALRPRQGELGTRIDIQGLGKMVTNRETGQPLWLLRDVELVVLPGQFVGLLGSSGCGKSTLMDAMNGRRRATQGQVLYDGSSLYDKFEAFKGGIGYVPQQLIFHETLPLSNALRYTSQLRLAGDTSGREIEENINRVLETVGLADRRDTLIRDLSGGQKKRVSIAMELLSRPKTLFLDEVTSGLDLGTEQQMMELFRKLADDGMTLVCITHYVDSLEMCDAVAYLVKGHMGFYGPPEQFRSHMGIDAIRHVYAKEAERTPTEWHDLFRRSAAYERYVRRFVEPADEVADATETPDGPEPPQPTTWTDFGRQTGILLKRYSQILTIDRRNVMVLIGLAPIVAMLISVVGAATDDTEFGRAGRQNILCFGSMLTMLFLGLFGSIREIVKELDVYRHERFINLQIGPYLLSKVMPLAVVGAIQAAILTLILNAWGGLEAGSVILQFLLLLVFSLAGTMLGLALSAAVSTADWAVMSMIAVVIPQLLFAGAILKLKGASEVIGQVFVVGYWAHAAMTGLLDEGVQQRLPSPPEGSAVGAIAMVLLHAAGYGLIALVFLARKDGPGAVKRLILGTIERILGAKPPETPETP